jgi:hypothetical protein
MQGFGYTKEACVYDSKVNDETMAATCMYYATDSD